jgi:hypothetical protein
MGSRASVHMSAPRRPPLLLRQHAHRGALHHSAGRYSTVTLPIATSLSMAMSMQTGRACRKGHDRQPLLQRSQRADSPVGAGRDLLIRGSWVRVPRGLRPSGCAWVLLGCCMRSSPAAIAGHIVTSACMNAWGSRRTLRVQASLRCYVRRARRSAPACRWIGL